MMWLVALRQETDLVVPEPVSTCDGDLLTITGVEEVPEPRICVLLRWIPGRFLDDGLTPAHLERVGEFMAHLQLHGARFRPPDGFARGRVDNLTHRARAIAAQGTSEAIARQQVDNPTDEADAIRLVTETCSPEDGARVETLIGRVREVQRLVGQGPETFGLIHGDLHQENYFFHQGRVRAIDFDDCGYGYYLYDMAATLSEVSWRENTPALRESFLAGYRSVRSLSAGHMQYLDTFIALRYLQVMIWLVELRNHPAFRDTWASSVEELLQGIREFVEH
jgi:Ser/Thr protein kinase RdoA (MazF antagonist)